MEPLIIPLPSTIVPVRVIVFTPKKAVTVSWPSTVCKYVPMPLPSTDQPTTGSPLTSTPVSSQHSSSGSMVNSTIVPQSTSLAGRVSGVESTAAEMIPHSSSVSTAPSTANGPNSEKAIFISILIPCPGRLSRAGIVSVPTPVDEFISRKSEKMSRMLFIDTHCTPFSPIINSVSPHTSELSTSIS